MKTRSYDSRLRDQQAEGTRDQILEAVVRVLAKGPAELSVPAVAAEAGVSVATVYRHFGSKRGLVEALYGLYTKRIGTVALKDDVTDIEGFLRYLPDIFRRHEQVDPALRAAMSGAVAKRAIRADMPARLKLVERALANSAPDVDGPDAEMLRDVIVVLGSYATQRAFRDFLDLGSDDAATRVDWAIRKLLEACQEKKGTG